MTGTDRRIIWSAIAERDLFDIWDYLRRAASAEVADAQLRAIDRLCRRVLEWPYSGPSREALLAGLRSALVNNYVIFYRLSDQGIEIVRVLDARRDVDALFAED